MKKALSLLLAAFIIVPCFFTAVLAEEDEEVFSGTCGEYLTWTFDPETSELSIEGTGEMSDSFTYQDNSEEDGIRVTSPWRFFTDMIKTVKISEGVTTVGNCAFVKCSALESISVPDSVTVLKDMCFGQGESLKFTVYGNANYIGNESNPYLILFSSAADDVTSCEIHENTRFVYNYAFKDNALLESVTVPENVLYIMDGAFTGCTKLKDIYYGGSKADWEYVPLSIEDYDIYENVQVHYAKGWTKLTIPILIVLVCVTVVTAFIRYRKLRKNKA